MKTFAGVVRDRQTYRNVLYLLLAIPLGGLYYTGLLFGFVIGIASAVALTGIPIVFATNIGSRFFVRIECQLTNALLNTDIRPPSDVPSLSSGEWWMAIKRCVTASSTWKGMAFLVVKSFIGLISFFLLLFTGFTALGLVLSPLGGSMTIMEFWTIDSFGESLLAVPLGIILALVTFHILNGNATVTGTIATSLLDS